MLETASPLNNVTNRAPFEETPANLPPAALAAPPCFLSLLADASLLEEAASAKKAKVSPFPAPLQCADSLELGTVVAYPPLETTIRAKVTAVARPSSANGESTSGSSRATSPGVPGRSYLCKACGREYASTDAVRKHARQNHTEWLREMGQGSPLLYCTPIDKADTVVDTATSVAPSSAGGSDLGMTVAIKARVSADLVATPPPLATFSAYQHKQAALIASKTAAAMSAAANGGAGSSSLSIGSIPLFSALTPAASSASASQNFNSASAECSTPLSPGSSSMLMNAAESLSMFAGRGNIYARRQEEENEEDFPSWLSGSQHWPAPAGQILFGKKQGGGMKRPRSVRCGKCDGCERDDCGTCKNCVDKPKFGGIGQRKQGCIRKLCRQPRVAA